MILFRAILFFFIFITPLKADSIYDLIKIPNLEIYNINSYSAYHSVLKQLKKLEVIDSVDLFSARGNQIIMSVEAEGGQELLSNALVRSGRFRDRNADIETENQQLTFDWIK